MNTHHKITLFDGKCDYVSWKHNMKSLLVQQEVHVAIDC